MTTDAFNLHESVFGPHPDEFFGAVGRIVCVCAVLEQKVAAIAQALNPDGTNSRQPVSAQAEAARKMSHSMRPEDGARIRDYLNRIEDAFATRNAIAHGAFPAQADGRLWSHRAARGKGPAETLVYETTIEEMVVFISELSHLARDFNQVFAVCP